MECFICGVKGEKTMLFGAIVREGVVKICESCSINENIPIVKRITDLQLKESEKNQTVYEKLSKMAGLDPKEHKAKFGSGVERLEQQNQSLRKVVEERQELSFPNLKKVEVNSKDDLIHNYHWAIFKARRARRLTQKQLAEAISESEASVKLVERGILPDNYQAFIKKIQTYLGVTILTKPVKQELSFDDNSKGLTVSDLNEMEEKAEVPYWKKKFGFLYKKREQRLEELDEEMPVEEIKPAKEGEDVDVEEIKKVLNSKQESDRGELSQEDMDKILFEDK